MASNNGDVTPEYSKHLVGKVGLAVHDEAARKLYPTLIDLLTPRFDKKRRMTREGGSISLKPESGLWRVTVRCPTDEAETHLLTPTVCDLFEQLERHVSSGATVWVQTYDSVRRARRGLDKSLE